MTQEVFINSFGKFLPNQPVSNNEMEEILGFIGGKPSRYKSKILRQNGILTRYYAIGKDRKTKYWNYELAASAINDALRNSEILKNKIEYLAAATSQSDLLAPSFASLVHSETKIPSCEIASFSGICASGVMALQSAFQGIRSGLRRNSIVCASEFTSRFFRKELFEETKSFKNGEKISFDSEFLRWMLSDGAGACILENKRNEKGISLKIEWIDLVSYADKNDVCMYSGANKKVDGKLEKSWFEYENLTDAVEQSAVLLKQDVRILENVVKLGVNRYFELIGENKFLPKDIDWLVCHYSSHIFRGLIIELLEKGGGMIPEDKWFTNLYSKGNTGAASIFIMLEELFKSGKLQAGQKILCMVPESGQFIISYFLLTVVNNNGSDNQVIEVNQSNDVNKVEFFQLKKDSNQQKQKLVRELTKVWIEFENKLNQVPIIDKLNRGKFRIEDYQELLLNLRQQVVEGGRWIARAASNIEYEIFDLRSIFIGHAQEEHRDFQMIERDYVSIGGRLEVIQNAEKNIGSEALSAWMFHRAGQTNPFDLLGAMFIIEGLGKRMANSWGEKIRQQLKLNKTQISFLLYHGENDENHFEKLERAFESEILSEEIVKRIVKTAKVTARLYLLQLDELGNC